VNNSKFLNSHPLAHLQSKLDAALNELKDVETKLKVEKQSTASTTASLQAEKQRADSATATRNVAQHQQQEAAAEIVSERTAKEKLQETLDATIECSQTTLAATIKTNAESMEKMQAEVDQLRQKLGAQEQAAADAKSEATKKHKRMVKKLRDEDVMKMRMAVERTKEEHSRLKALRHELREEKQATARAEQAVRDLESERALLRDELTRTEHNLSERLVEAKKITEEDAVSLETLTHNLKEAESELTRCKLEGAAERDMLVARNEEFIAQLEQQHELERSQALAQAHAQRVVAVIAASSKAGEMAALAATKRANQAHDSVLTEKDTATSELMAKHVDVLRELQSTFSSEKTRTRAESVRAVVSASTKAGEVAAAAASERTKREMTADHAKAIAKLEADHVKRLDDLRAELNSALLRVARADEEVSRTRAESVVKVVSASTKAGEIAAAVASKRTKREMTDEHVKSVASLEAEHAKKLDALHAEVDDTRLRVVRAEEEIARTRAEAEVAVESAATEAGKVAAAAAAEQTKKDMTDEHARSVANLEAEYIKKLEDSRAEIDDALSKVALANEEIARTRAEAEVAVKSAAIDAGEVAAAATSERVKNELADAHAKSIAILEAEHARKLDSLRAEVDGALLKVARADEEVARTQTEAKVAVKSAATKAWGVATAAASKQAKKEMADEHAISVAKLEAEYARKLDALQNEVDEALLNVSRAKKAATEAGEVAATAASERTKREMTDEYVKSIADLEVEHATKLGALHAEVDDALSRFAIADEEARILKHELLATGDKNIDIDAGTASEGEDDEVIYTTTDAAPNATSRVEMSVDREVNMDVTKTENAAVFQGTIQFGDAPNEEPLPTGGEINDLAHKVGNILNVAEDGNAVSAEVYAETAYHEDLEASLDSEFEYNYAQPIRDAVNSPGGRASIVVGLANEQMAAARRELLPYVREEGKQVSVSPEDEPRRVNEQIVELLESEAFVDTLEQEIRASSHGLSQDCTTVGPPRSRLVSVGRAQSATTRPNPPRKNSARRQASFFKRPLSAPASRSFFSKPVHPEPMQAEEITAPTTEVSTERTEVEPLATDDLGSTTEERPLSALVKGRRANRNREHSYLSAPPQPRQVKSPNLKRGRTRDYSVLVDASSSMRTIDRHILCQSDQQQDRWNQAREVLEFLVPEVVKRDEDGISLYFFSTGYRKFTHVNSSDVVKEKFSSTRPKGGTQLADALKDAVIPDNRGRPETILVITDGAPEKRRAVEKVLLNASEATEYSDDLRVVFVQVGFDAEASRWLSTLDARLGCPDGVVNTATTAHLQDSGLSMSEWVDQFVLVDSDFS